MTKKISLHMKNDKTMFNAINKKCYARNHNKQINDYSYIEYTENIPKFSWNLPMCLSLDLAFRLVTGDIKFPVQKNIHENSMYEDHAQNMEQYSHLS